MKLLLLVTLLTAGATAHSISRWAVQRVGNVFECPPSWKNPFTLYSYYDCYCLYSSRSNQREDLKMCCRTHDNCYAQAKKLDSRKLLVDNPYTTSYSDPCSESEITCSDENNPCEADICNYDCQAAICFSNTPYTKYYSGISC